MAKKWHKWFPNTNFCSQLTWKQLVTTCQSGGKQLGKAWSWAPSPKFKPFPLKALAFLNLKLTGVQLANIAAESIDSMDQGGHAFGFARFLHIVVDAFEKVTQLCASISFIIFAFLEQHETFLATVDRTEQTIGRIGEKGTWLRVASVEEILLHESSHFVLVAFVHSRHSAIFLRLFYPNAQRSHFVGGHGPQGVNQSVDLRLHFPNIVPFQNETVQTFFQGGVDFGLATGVVLSIC